MALRVRVSLRRIVSRGVVALEAQADGRQGFPVWQRVVSGRHGRQSGNRPLLADDRTKASPPCMRASPPRLQTKPELASPVFAPCLLDRRVEQARQMLDRNLRPDVADGQADARFVGSMSRSIVDLRFANRVALARRFDKARRNRPASKAPPPSPQMRTLIPASARLHRGTRRPRPRAARLPTGLRRAPLAAIGLRQESMS